MAMAGVGRAFDTPRYVSPRSREKGEPEGSKSERGLCM